MTKRNQLDVYRKALKVGYKEEQALFLAREIPFEFTAEKRTKEPKEDRLKKTEHDLKVFFLYILGATMIAWFLVPTLLKDFGIKSGYFVGLCTGILLFIGYFAIGSGD